MVQFNSGLKKTKAINQQNVNLAAFKKHQMTKPACFMEAET